MINSNWHPISYRFGVIAAYCSNFAPTHSLWLKISGKRGRPPTIIFARIVRPMNALQLCPRQFSHRCYGWGATSENRSKIGDFAPTWSLWSKISGTRGHPWKRVTPFTPFHGSGVSWSLTPDDAVFARPMPTLSLSREPTLGSETGVFRWRDRKYGTVFPLHCDNPTSNSDSSNDF